MDQISTGTQGSDSKTKTWRVFHGFNVGQPFLPTHGNYVLVPPHLVSIWSIFRMGRASSKFANNYRRSGSLRLWSFGRDARGPALDVTTL